MEPPRSLRFGPFELDPRAGEIRKHGVKIHLPDQSFQILLMLIEHPGEVVLREEIRKKLWPNDTVVEFDHSINAAIKRLRSALGESADDPVYIETLAKRGYRFRGEIERVGEPPARTISHYRVLEKLGSGGMGEVWKALDERLNREVAIKISGEQFTDRFEREARAIASLNHSNICTLHDVGPNYLVMELVEGETLAERIRRGPIPLEETLAIARQIAAALEAAHDKGIVHRDLKPGNVMIRTDGTVKVLDFGLAKAASEGSDSTPDSPTIFISMPGVIVGTPGYMSPEQACGQKVDKRTDNWAFGAVLYEMVTGRRLPEEPDWTKVPARLHRLLRLCLEKDPNRRLRDISGVGLLLDTVEHTTTAPSQSRLVKPAWIAAGVLALVAAGASLAHFLEKPPAPAVPVRFQIPVPPDAPPTGNADLSPDGRKLAFRSGTRLRVHSLESGESRDLAETDHSPFWSPDSRFIGYVFQGKLRKVEETGGPSQIVADVTGRWGGAAWNRDDVIVFGDLQVGLFRVPASGGTPVQITSMNTARHETTHFSPSFLPDGRHFVYIRTTVGKGAIYLGSIDAKPEQQASVPLMASTWQPGFARSSDLATGYLLFMRENDLMAQPFDTRRLALKGQAALVAEQVNDNGGGQGGHADFSVSSNDVLMFQRSAAPQLAWYDREGNALGTMGDPGEYSGVSLSPDSNRLAAIKAAGAGRNIWLLDLSRGAASTRFTFGSAQDVNPVWSPDGSRIVFSSNRDGVYNLYQKPVDGAKDDELLLKSGENKFATSWSRDGRFLLYQVQAPSNAKLDIWVLPMEGDRKPFPYLVTEFNQGLARFSPDGHWVTYSSNESGQDEIYVRPFSVNAAGTALAPGGKWAISNGPGTGSRWRDDGRELYFRTLLHGLQAVDIAAGPVFRAGTPHSLGGPFPTSSSTGKVLWDSARDGKRFIGLAPNSGLQPYTLILNWQAGLKK